MWAALDFQVILWITYGCVGSVTCLLFYYSYIWEKANGDLWGWGKACVYSHEQLCKVWYCRTGRSLLTPIQNLGSASLCLLFCCCRDQLVRGQSIHQWPWCRTELLSERTVRAGLAAAVAQGHEQGRAWRPQDPHVPGCACLWPLLPSPPPASAPWQRTWLSGCCCVLRKYQVARASSNTQKVSEMLSLCSGSWSSQSCPRPADKSPFPSVQAPC